jgi:archaemetzincin
MSYWFSTREQRTTQLFLEETPNSCSNLAFEVFAHGIDSESAEVVVETLRFFKPRKIEVRALKEVPETSYNLIRHQYNGFLVAKWLDTLRTAKDSVVLGVLNVDAYVDPLNFIFGLALPELNLATVYVARLKINATKSGFIARIKKEVVHEVGHVFGLRHCRNKSCVMSFSNSLADVDRKDFRMCSTHYAELKNRVPCVSDELLQPPKTGT